MQWYLEFVSTQIRLAMNAEIRIAIDEKFDEVA
jgi:hypothetical protein